MKKFYLTLLFIFLLVISAYAQAVFVPPGDVIYEGNTEAETVDTGSDGHFKVTTEGTERLRVDSNGASTFYGDINVTALPQKISSGSPDATDSSWLGGLVFDSNNDDINDVLIDTGGAITSKGRLVVNNYIGGYAPSFNGTTSSISIPANSATTAYDGVNNQYSFECWVYTLTDGEGDVGNIVRTSGNVINNPGFRLHVLGGSGSLRGKIGANAGHTTSVATSATANRALYMQRWTHVGVVYNEDLDNKLKIYVDGVLSSLSTQTAGVGTYKDDTASDMYIGNNSTGSETWNGYIRNAVFYKGKALTAAEMLNRFKKVAVTGATASWLMNEGTGTTVDDAVGSNNGTLNNVTWIFNDIAKFDGATRIYDGSNTNYIEAYHQGTDGYIKTNTGNLYLESTGGNVVANGQNVCLEDGTNCSGGGGVNSGLAGYLSYYATTGTTLSPTTNGIFFDGTNIGIGTTAPAYLLDVNGIARFQGSGGVTLDNGGALRTTVTSGHTALLQAYNTGTVSYTTFGTLTAGSSPTFDISASTTIGSDTIVSRTGSQTLTNKTLTLPVISSISNSGTVTIPTGTDTLVNLTATQTLTNKTLTSPKIGTALLDTNGNNYFTLTPATTAVNYLNYTNAATGANPTYTVTGDANRGLSLTMAGTGGVEITSTNTGPSTISRGLTINNGSNNGAGDDLTVKTGSSATAFVVDASADTVNVGVALILTPMASAPGSPTSGMMYMDSTASPDELCVYDGAGWQGISSGTDGNCS